jgi:hypothetical protein
VGVYCVGVGAVEESEDGDGDGGEEEGEARDEDEGHATYRGRHTRPFLTQREHVGRAREQGSDARVQCRHDARRVGVRGRRLVSGVSGTCVVVASLSRVVGEVGGVVAGEVLVLALTLRVAGPWCACGTASKMLVCEKVVVAGEAAAARERG